MLFTIGEVITRKEGDYGSGAEKPYEEGEAVAWWKEP